MNKFYFLVIVLTLQITISRAQTTAMNFSKLDCAGNQHNLFADLDEGKVVILHFYMPSCGSCPPPAQQIQTMANRVNSMYPGKVIGYAFPFQNSTPCSYSSTWVSSNSLSTLYTSMDSGATQVSYYGGFGMPTVVVLGGTDHKILFSTLSFSTSDTTIMRDKIIALLSGTSGLKNESNNGNSFSAYPNPASDLLTITFDLISRSNTLIDITDITGKQIVIIVNEDQSGSVKSQFNTESLPNGIYFIRLQVNGGSTSIQKISIVH